MEFSAGKTISLFSYRAAASAIAVGTEHWYPVLIDVVNISVTNNLVVGASRGVGKLALKISAWLLQTIHLFLLFLVSFVFCTCCRGVLNGASRWCRSAD